MHRTTLVRRTLVAVAVAALPAAMLAATAATASAQQPAEFTRADTLRGTNGPARAWWDVTFYDLHVAINPADSTIRGRNGITYRVLKPGSELQIDLQMPLVVDSMKQAGRKLDYRRDGDAFFATTTAPQRAGSMHTVTVYYHGTPVVAKNPPWDGGLIWRTDSVNNLWVATANQGLGASVWWPNKDYGEEEPDSQRIAITVPDPMMNISNGRLRSTVKNGDGTTTYEWFVTNPINNYGIAINAGQYAHYSEDYAGEKGRLTLDFYPLAIHLDTAKVQWKQTIPMLACFEKWFGPYPWYEDGFKLIETPHLGMEHQSAVAYGNRFKNGYNGRDLSGTGHGMKWDFIIIHEAAHEWWANNITAKDQADMWVHESFANYAEGIYTECQSGKQAGAEYIIGSRRGIRNDKPIIPAFGVNAQGSGDMYPKGGSMLHGIRSIIDNDEKWRGILRGLNSTFWHQTVTGMQVRDYISKQAGIDFGKVFQQYLETTMVPALEVGIADGKLSYRWSNVVPGFDMPVDVDVNGTGYARLRPTTTWQTVPTALTDAAAVKVDPDFYVTVKPTR